MTLLIRSSFIVRLDRVRVLTACLLLAFAGPVLGQPTGLEPPGPGQLLSPGLVPLSDLGALASGVPSAGVQSLVPADLGPGSSVADAVAALSAGGIRAAEREFQRIVAGGGLARVVVRTDSGTSGSATEIWARYVDGVRLLGASVRRVVSSGQVADVQGFVPAPGSAASEYQRWPEGSSVVDAGRSLSTFLGGVEVFPESGPGGAPVRLWMPGFAVDVVRPVFVFVTADGRLFAADAETGVPLLEQSTVSVFDPAEFSRASVMQLGADASSAGANPLAGPSRPAAGEGPLSQRRSWTGGAWDGIEFGELRGVDVSQARSLGYGSGLRLDRLLLNLFDPRAVGLPGPHLLLDVFDVGTGYQATFDARRAAASVPDRCEFASRFFLPDAHPDAYGRAGGARLAHLAAAPNGVVGARNAEDRTVAEAHALMTYARRYYRELVDWRGIDNRGGATPILVNVLPYGGDRDYTCPWLPAFHSNAFFAYGGGPWGAGGFGFGTWQPSARSLASAVDVIGHEFVHAIAVHGRRNVFGSALGYIPQQVYVRSEAAPGRVTEYGSAIECGLPIDHDVLADVRSLYSSLFGFFHVPLFPYCTNVFPYRLVVGVTADASEGVSDVGGVGTEFALASHGVIEPDYRMGEDLDGFGIRNLQTAAGGFRHFNDLRRSLLVTRSPDVGCVGLVSVVTLHQLPPKASHGLCALSPIGMFGSRPGSLDLRRPLSPHPIGVVIGHAFYLAIEGGSGPGGIRVVAGAGRERVHDLVWAFLSVTAYTQPESFSLPAMAWAVLARIDERFGPHDPLWHSFAAAALATGILFR